MRTAAEEVVASNDKDQGDIVKPNIETLKRNQKLKVQNKKGQEKCQTPIKLNKEQT